MQLYVVSEGLGDHIKLVAEGHFGLVERIDRLEKENERQHLETRSHQILKKPNQRLRNAGTKWGGIYCKGSTRSALMDEASGSTCWLRFDQYGSRPFHN